MRRKNLINKQERKRCEGKCYFCPESDYSLLDVHRIVEGQDGGKYTNGNTVVVCSNCHRKIHAEQIKIDRYYLASNGKNVLHYWDAEGEQWK